MGLLNNRGEGGGGGANNPVGGTQGQNSRATASLLAYIQQLTGMHGKAAQGYYDSVMQNSPGMSPLQLNRAMANNPREMTPGAATPQRVGPGAQLGNPAGGNFVPGSGGLLGGVHAGPGGGGGGGQGGGAGGGSGGGGNHGGAGGGGGSGMGNTNVPGQRFDNGPGKEVQNWNPTAPSWEWWDNIPGVAGPSQANPMGGIGQYLGQQYSGSNANTYGANPNGGGGIPWNKLYGNQPGGLGIR